MAKFAFVVLAAVLFASCQASTLSRIVHGSPAINFQFPWHVSLRITVTNSMHESFCGATLISNTFLLTAASCLRNAASIQADFGSILFSTPLLTVHSTQWLIHGQFNANFNTNDIAIVRLPQPIEFSANISPIHLPTMSQANDLFVDSEVFVAGFGVTVNGGNVMSEELRFAHQRVITNAECLRHFNPQFIQPSTVCAIGINNSLQSPCFGDRGGALITSINNRWIQIGITSIFHSSGCPGTVPAAFSRITPHLQWISINTGIPIDW